MGIIKHFLSVGFHSILLWLDAIVYQFVAVVYNIFMILAGMNIFSQSFYQDFAQRVYAILGVVMLFVLAYALLQGLVDPDKITKADKGIGKIVPTFVVSLIIIGLLPSIFDFAYNVQNFILEENTIGTLVFGSSATTPDAEAARNNFGKQLAFTSLQAFLNQEDPDSDAQYGGLTWREIESKIAEDSANFSLILNLTDAIADGEVTYRWGFSTAVGLFLIYVIVNFCLDLAVRSVRLAFLQLMAPIPILMRVLPTKNDVFKNWLKKTTSCFTEVFVRVFIMYMAVYFISNLDINWASWGANGLTAAVANVLVIMGILMFVKEFPKLLSDITGIDSGNIKLGIKDFMGKLGAGGVFAAGGIAGAGITAMTRNALHAKQNMDKATGFKGKAAAFGRGLTSVLAGSVSGAVRGGMAGYNAKNFSDTVKAAGKGAKGATDARDRREAYRAAHGNSLGGVASGHITDMWKGAKEWAQGGFEAEEAKIKMYDELLKRKDKAKAEAEALMNRNPTNAKMVAHDTVQYKGVSDESQSQFINMFNGQSLGTIKQQIEKMKKDGVARENFMHTDATTGEKVFDEEAYNAASLKRSALMNDMDAMYKQLEKATIMKLQNAAFDQSLASSMGIDDPNKFSGIRSEIQQIRDYISEQGGVSGPGIDHQISDADLGKSMDDFMTDVQNVRNINARDLERKKRDREARQRNRGGSGGGNS